MTNDFKKASVLQDVPTFTTDGTIMTDKSEKVDERAVERILVTAMQAADRAFPACGGGTKHYVRECFLPELEKLGARIELADSPTAAEARAEVIRELREWEAEQHTVWMASLGQLFVEQVLSDLRAKLTELERVK